MTGNDESFKNYIRSRTQNIEWKFPSKPSFGEKLEKATLQKLATKMSCWHLGAVSILIPKSLRGMVFVRTGIGERHRWMYDGYALALLFKDAGFREARRVAFDESSIPGFNADCLDCNPDGTPYKCNSIYMEGVK